MMNMISKSALLILVIALVYLLLTGNILATSPFVIAGQLAAIALSVWARRSFQGGQFSIHAEPVEGSLLSTGPYKWIRHPMYAAALLLIWSSVLGHLTLSNVLVGAIVTVAIAMRILTEEQLLLASYPNYAEYKLQTKRIIPFLI